MIRVRLLGQLAVEYQGQSSAPPSGKQAQLFALLVEEDGNWITREAVAQRLWDEPARPSSVNPIVSRFSNWMREVELDQFLDHGHNQERLQLPSDTVVDCVEAVRTFEDALAAYEGSEDDHNTWGLAVAAEKLLRETYLVGERSSSPFLEDRRRALEARRTESLALLAQLGLRSSDRERRRSASAFASRACDSSPNQHWELAVEALIERDQSADAIALIDRLQPQLVEPAATQATAYRERIVRSRRPRLPRLELPVVRGRYDNLPLVGRDAELAALQRRLDPRGRSPTLPAVVLTGPSGIGKSRLLRDFAAWAYTRGAHVLMGPMLVEDLPCRPVVSALTQYVRMADHHYEAVHEAAHWEIVQTLTTRKGVAQPAQRPAATVVSKALAQVLADLARIRPLLLVLEDLHESDPQTTELMRRLNGRAPSGLLILGAWRTGRTLHPEYENWALSLEPLGAEAHDELYRAHHGDTDTGKLQESLARTSGVPFYVIHDSSPDQVVALVLGRFSADARSRARHILAAGAEYGPEFDPTVVGRALGLDPSIVKQLVARATETCVLVPSNKRGAFVFEHGEMRSAFRETLSEEERRDISAALAPLLAAGAHDPALAARHGRRAARAQRGDTLAAARAGMEAGTRALTLFAYAAALRHLESAQDFADQTDDLVLACEIRLQRGETLWSLGRVRDAREQFQGVAKTAEANGDTDLLGRAALGFGGRLGFEGVTTSREYVRILEAALAANPESGSQLAVRLRAALAGALTFSDAQEAARGQRLGRRALDEARATADPILLADVLSSACWSQWQPDDVAGRGALAQEFVAAADRADLPAVRFDARVFQLAALLEEGEVGAMDRIGEECRELAELTRLPHYQALATMLSASQALSAGRLDDAADLIQSALDLGNRDQNPAVFELYGVQMLLFELLRGRLDLLRAAAQALTANFQGLAAWKAGLATVYAELGRTDDAAAILDHLSHDQWSAIPRDLFWLITMEHLARACALVGDARTARELYELIAPYSDRVVVAGGAVAVYGSAHHCLGLLARTLGDHDAAVEHLESAVIRNDEIGERALNARVRAHLAETLGLRAAPGDAETAREHHAIAEREAQELSICLVTPPEARRYASTGDPSGRTGTTRARLEEAFLQFAARRIDSDPDMDRRRWQLSLRALPGTLKPLYRPGAACGEQRRVKLRLREDDSAAFVDVLTFDVGEHAAIRRGSTDACPQVLTMSPATFFGLVVGRLNAVEAWLDGRVVVEGDPVLAARLIDMFAGERPPDLATQC